MTSNDPARDPEGVPTLQELIQTRRTERGWSYRELERRSGGVILNQRWHQFANGAQIKEFPERRTLLAVAETLEFDVTTVVLAVASSMGMAVQRRGSELAQMLPTKADQLSPPMRDAVLAVVRAAVNEAGDEAPSRPPEAALEADETIPARERNYLLAMLAEIRRSSDRQNDEELRVTYSERTKRVAAPREEDSHADAHAAGSDSG